MRSIAPDRPPVPGIPSSRMERHATLRRLTGVAGLLLGLLTSPVSAAAQATFYHSPADDGVAATAPVVLTPGGSGSLFLYLQSSGIPSSDPTAVCVDAEGAEVCAAELVLHAAAPISFTGFVPDPGIDIVHALEPHVITINALDAVSPTVGPKRYGELQWSVAPIGCAAGSCDVTVDAATIVEADLALAVPSLTTGSSSLATVPEPGLGAALAAGILSLAWASRRRAVEGGQDRRRCLASIAHRPGRGGTLVLLLPFVVASLGPPAARAQLETLPDAEYETRCDGAPKTLPVANSSFCDRPQAFAWTSGELSATASASAVVSAEAFSSRPRLPNGIPLELAQRLQPLLLEPFVVVAFVQAEATYTLTSGPLIPPPPGFNRSQIDGTAAVSSSFGIREIASPPLALPAVPLKLRVRGEITVNGIAETSATIRVTVNGDPEDSFEFTTPGAVGFFSVDQEFPGEFFEIEVGQDFTKQAFCSAEARWPGGTSFCSVVLDPIIELDQATLDALLGANSFPLEDFYALEFSPNLTIDAPANVCGDINQDDLVLADDLTLLRQARIGQASLDAGSLDRCATRSGSTGCDLADVVVLARTVGSGAPRAPGIEPACAAVTGG